LAVTVPRLNITALLSQCYCHTVTLSHGHCHLTATSIISHRKQVAEAIEAIQRRAIHIIYPVTTSMSYWVTLRYAELPSLSCRRDKLCRDFFPQIT